VSAPERRVLGTFVSALYKVFGGEESRTRIRVAQTMNRTNGSAGRCGRLLMAAALWAAGWSTVAASEVERQKVASANVGFAFKLLKEIVREEPGRNVFISPFGASSVLQMACTGAGGRRGRRWNVCWERQDWRPIS